MNYNTMFLLKGQPNDDITNSYYDNNTNKQVVTFKNNKIYTYAKNNFIVLNNPKEIDSNLYNFTNNDGVTLFNISKIYEFKYLSNTYYKFLFKNDTYKSYKSYYFTIAKNSLADTKIKNLFDYYKCLSDKIGLKANDGTNILKEQFEKIKLIDNNSVLSKFLKVSKIESKKLPLGKCIVFPFGCNLSQIKAVNNAMNNSISVIEGPPGTGKTQTILNIISNIVINNQTVAVVSNNNSAIDNVFEKLDVCQESCRIKFSVRYFDKTFQNFQLILVVYMILFKRIFITLILPQVPPSVDWSYVNILDIKS